MKAYTGIAQSKRLAQILSLESADMWYSYNGNSKYNPTIAYKGEQWFLCQTKNSSHSDIPAWSLSALLDLMPKIHGERPKLDTGRIQTEKYYVEYPYHESTKNDWYSTKLCDSAVDACYEMILKLKELNLL